MKLGYIKYDIYPLVFVIGLTLFRIFIVSIRHASTPPRIYRHLYTEPITKENLNEALLLSAWIFVSEEGLTTEITKALLKNEVYQDFFTFKVFLPVYPPMRERLKN